MKKISDKINSIDDVATRGWLMLIVLNILEKAPGAWFAHMTDEEKKHFKFLMNHVQLSEYDRERLQERAREHKI